MIEYDELYKEVKNRLSEKRFKHSEAVVKRAIDIVKKDINQGMIEICKWVVNRLLENNKLIHLNSIKCYNYYTKLEKF